MPLPRLSILSAGFVLVIAVVSAVGPHHQSSKGQDLSSASAGGGVDLAGMDRSVKPGDDFFAYANGAWIKAAKIPPDRSSYGLDPKLAEEANLHTRELLEAAARGIAPAGSDERKVGDYYAAYMDEATIETKGLKVLDSQLDQIKAISDRQALAASIARTLRTDVDPLNNTEFHTHHLFGVWIAQDFNEPTRYAPYVLQGGLGMPDREYYLDESPRMAEIRTKYKTHIAAVLKLGGIAETKAERIFDLETKIASVHWNRVSSEEVQKANNLWKLGDFASKAPGLNWDIFFKVAGLDAQSIILVWQPSAITGEAALVGNEPLETWKDYLSYQILDDWSNFLPKAFVQERFAFYGQVLSGTPQLRERWKRAVDYSNLAMGDAVGKLYVQHHFSPEAKAKAKAMVADLVQAFGRRIDNLTWMSADTKARARDKLTALKVGVGYPDRWRDYQGLEISRDSAFRNAFMAELNEYRRNLAKLGHPVDRSEWWMTPQTVNAVNLPIQNALNFPAAILQPPYFDPKADAANNYGAIGAVIGHEISHSFDDQGSQFDAEGRLANWWTPADLSHFKEASSRLVAQYNMYHPFPDLAVNGQQTLGENIADVAGLSAAYDAYRLSLGGKSAPMRQGLTGDQQFFISFAQSWRDKYREPLLRQLIVTDGHAPSEYRADTVRNIDVWYDAFHVEPGQALYLAPGNRVHLW